MIGAKVRAVIDEARSFDIHYDPTTKGYSYALVDLRLPYPDDKQLFGWDDYPHEGVVNPAHCAVADGGVLFDK